MELNKEQLALLADLSTMPAYNMLMGMLTDHQVRILSALQAATDEKEVVRIARFYQAFQTIKNFLATEPALADERLKALEESMDIREVDPQFLDPDLIHRLRFADPTN